MKGKTKRILVSVVKIRHRANGPLKTKRRRDWGFRLRYSSPLTRALSLSQSTMTQKKKIRDCSQSTCFLILITFEYALITWRQFLWFWHRVPTFFISSNSMTFSTTFFSFFHDLKFSCHFRKLSTLNLF